MYSKLKRDDFIKVMENLTNLVVYEGDPDIINIHITVSVSAPTLCNTYVVDFKQYSKSHLAILESNFKKIETVDMVGSNDVEIIALDDD